MKKWFLIAIALVMLIAIPVLATVVKEDMKFTKKVTRTSQQYIQSVAYAKAGAGAGWTISAGDNVSLATMAASQTAGTMVVPITIPLKVGDIITAFSVVGQIEGDGNVTLDANLRKHTAAAADVVDASVDSITQVAVAVDSIVSASVTLTTPETVAANETFYVLLTGTTAAGTDIAIQGITVTVTEN